MNIVCAESVLCGREALATLGNVRVLPDRRITAADLRDAEALVVRSKTRVDDALLEGTAVGFVGTATAGFDHFDTDALDRRGVAWCAAPGCNANSVAEYVVAALLVLAERDGRTLAGRKLAVVGVGQVGGRVAAKAGALGMTVLRHDPPLALATGDPAYLSREAALGAADAVTLHVPLTRAGPLATEHMVNCRFFAELAPGGWLVNAARGEVLDGSALRLALQHGVVTRAVLDVWEHEPDLDADLLARVTLGTPHIAGLSLEGRLNGTLQVYRQLCNFLEVEQAWNPAGILPPVAKEIVLDCRGLSEETALTEVVRRAYDIGADDAALRAGPAGGESWGRHFEALRKGCSARREFAAHRLRLAHAPPALPEKAAALGFSPVEG